MTTSELREKVAAAECVDPNCGLCELWQDIENKLWQMEQLEEEVVRLREKVRGLSGPKTED